MSKLQKRLQKKKKTQNVLVMKQETQSYLMTHACNPSTAQVQGQPGLHGDILPLKERTESEDIRKNNIKMLKSNNNHQMEILSDRCSTTLAATEKESELKDTDAYLLENIC